MLTIQKTILYEVPLIMKMAKSNTHQTHFLIKNRTNLLTQGSK